MLIQSKVAGLMMLLTAGCAASNENPSFPVTVADAQTDHQRMRGEPKSPARPIVILNGFGDPGAGGAYVGGELRRELRDPQVLCVSFLFCRTFDDCRRKVIAAVDAKWPSDDPNQTVEVDVIGLSMGGLVARYCAVPDSRSLTPLPVHPTSCTNRQSALCTRACNRLSPLPVHRERRGEGFNSVQAQGANPHPTSPGVPGEEQEGRTRRLKIGRLFTVASPHQGATRAESLPPLLKMQIDMRPNSDFLHRLQQAESDRPYDIVPYVRLEDEVVGAQYASPPGRQVWWVSKPPMQPAHIGAATDPRILADIIRRLRDETPLTTEPAAPLPVVQ